LAPWSYKLKICYALNVPNFYMNYMHDLEEKYWIKMRDRELSILAMQPVGEDPYSKRMETKWTVYLPLNFNIWEATWTIQESKIFQAPYANWLYYRILMKENNDTKCVDINFNNY
jgi:hypothetical protein